MMAFIVYAPPPLVKWEVSFLVRGEAGANELECFSDPPFLFRNKVKSEKLSSCNMQYIVHFMYLGFNCLKAVEPLQGDSLL